MRRSVGTAPAALRIAWSTRIGLRQSAHCTAAATDTHERLLRRSHDDDGIAHLQLNRPERLNTMAPPFFPALRDAVRRCDDAGDGARAA